MRTTAANKAITKYTGDNIPRITDEVCNLLACGYGLSDALALKAEYPSLTTWYEWLAKDSDIADKYARAREIQQDYEADQIVVIADTDPDAARARNRIDARKWRASKLNAKKYGDRLGLDVTTAPKSIDVIDAEILKLLAAAGVCGVTGSETTDDRPDAAHPIRAIPQTD